MKKELWKKVENSCYEISNIGNIKNSKTLKILKQSLDRYGYPRVSFYDNDKKLVYRTTHRLVAMAWIPNEDLTLQVNHKDGNKQNNCVENLEWVSAKKNIIHSFENLLNKNTNPIILFNKETNQHIDFRSIKDTAKHIGCHSSILVPLIKYSDKNPINGKYIVKVKNEEEIINKSNSLNFGKTVFVYDVLTNQVTEYPSILSASYFTGIRSLSSHDYTENWVFKIGYFITSDIESIPKFTCNNKDKISKQRTDYLLSPYKRRDFSYLTYDYYKKEEKEFEDLNSLIAYLDEIDPSRLTNKSALSCAINKSVKSVRNGLYKGLGVKNTNVNNPWYPYTEEIILRSKHGFPTPIKIYKVKINNEQKIIFGLKNLCEYFNYRTDKLLKNITHEDILKSINIPNISVIRLNSPIE